jgi:hypothetical protein
MLGDVGRGTMPVGDEHESGTRDGQHGPEEQGSRPGVGHLEHPPPTTSPTDSAHKPKLMGKIKGEMKILMELTSAIYIYMQC